MNEFDFSQALGQQNRTAGQAFNWGQKQQAGGLSNLQTLATTAGMPLGQGYGVLPGGGQLGGTKQLLRLAQAQQALVPDMNMPSIGSGYRTAAENERDRLGNLLLRQQVEAGHLNNLRGWEDWRSRQGFSFSPLDPQKQLAGNQATVANRNLFNNPNQTISGGDHWANRGQSPAMQSPYGTRGNPFGSVNTGLTASPAPFAQPTPVAPRLPTPALRRPSSAIGASARGQGRPLEMASTPYRGLDNAPPIGGGGGSIAGGNPMSSPGMSSMGPKLTPGVPAYAQSPLGSGPKTAMSEGIAGEIAQADRVHQAALNYAATRNQLANRPTSPSMRTRMAAQAASLPSNVTYVNRDTRGDENYGVDVQRRNPKNPPTKKGGGKGK